MIESVRIWLFKYLSAFSADCFSSRTEGFIVGLIGVKIEMNKAYFIYEVNGASSKRSGA